MCEEEEVIVTNAALAIEGYCHARPDCPVRPLCAVSAADVGCKLCFCYVCDVVASECPHWTHHFESSGSDRTWRAVKYARRNMNAVFDDSDEASDPHCLSTRFIEVMLSAASGRTLPLSFAQPLDLTEDGSDETEQDQREGELDSTRPNGKSGEDVHGDESETKLWINNEVPWEVLDSCKNEDPDSVKAHFLEQTKEDRSGGQIMMPTASSKDVLEDYDRKDTAPEVFIKSEEVQENVISALMMLDLDCESGNEINGPQRNALPL